MDWDVFISHAWEDKEDIARPLAEALREAGLRVWYDEFTLTLGDSLRRSIDRGLAQSRYGVVILSPNFFAKEWPQRELDGLVAKEVSSGKTVLPVWHNVTWEEVRRFSPTLADKLAVSTAKGLDAVVEEILRALREEHRPRPRPVAKPTPAKPWRPVNWKIVGAIAGVIGVLIAWGVWLVPKTGPKEQFNIRVPANVYWYDTGITVNTGDWLEINATGSWWDDDHGTGPDGDIRPSCRECLVPEGNYGELIGRITFAIYYGTSGMRAAGKLVSSSTPFRVGSSTFYMARQYGNLMLAMNESCNNGRRESCSEDNHGELEVKVTVKRRRWLLRY